MFKGFSYRFNYLIIIMLCAYEIIYQIFYCISERIIGLIQRYVSILSNIFFIRFVANNKTSFYRKLPLSANYLLALDGSLLIFILLNFNPNKNICKHMSDRLFNKQ